MGVSANVSGWTSHHVDMGGEWYNTVCPPGQAATSNMQAWYLNTSYNWGNYAWGNSGGPVYTISPNCGFNAQATSVNGFWSWNKS